MALAIYYGNSPVLVDGTDPQTKAAGPVNITGVINSALVTYNKTEWFNNVTGVRYCLNSITNVIRDEQGNLIDADLGWGAYDFTPY